MSEKLNKLKMTKVTKNKDNFAAEIPLESGDQKVISPQLTPMTEEIEVTRDRIGTIIGSNDLIWVGGNYYGRETVEERELSTQIPIFAVTPQEHEGVKVKELLLVFTEIQKSMILMDNLNLEQDITTMEVFTKGIDDIFNEAKFSALRIGTFNLDVKGNILGFSSEIPHVKMQIQQPVTVATDAQISLFLDNTEFLFIRNFQIGLITIFQTILPNLFDKLVKFPNFNSDIFIQRVCEIGNSMPPAIFSSILQDLEERRGARKEQIGFVIEAEGEKVKIGLTKELDYLKNPIIAIDDKSGATAILIIYSYQEDVIHASVIYTNPPTMINIRKGYPVRYVTWNDIKDALKPITGSRVPPISIPVGRIIGIQEMNEEVLNLKKSEDIEVLKQRSQGFVVQLPFEYNIVFIPGELANGIIIGDSGSGKSNGVKNIIVAIVIHNRNTTGQKIGLLIYDKDGEYSGMFKQIETDQNYQKILKCIQIGVPDQERFTLEDIPLEVFTDEDYMTPCEILIRFLHRAHPEQITHPYRMTVETLNFFLHPDNLNQMKEELEQNHFHMKRIEAISRRISENIIKIKQLVNIKPIDDITYEIDTKCKDLNKTLYDAQRNGRVIIIDTSNLKHPNAYPILTKLVYAKIQNMRENWFSEEWETNQGDQSVFTANAPMFLHINEEATNLFATLSNNEQIFDHIRAATGARKFNIGTLYVFQTLQGIESNIKLVLSQLGGFTFVFALTMEKSRELALGNVNIRGVNNLDQYIQNAKTPKYCIASSESYDRRPFFIKFYLAETYFQLMFNKKVTPSSREERKFEREKEERAKEPIPMKYIKPANPKKLFDDEERDTN